jgi:hypothetical protein
MRTILYWLSRLTKEGFLNHENNRYNLSNKIILDYEFAADIYGSTLLTKIWSIPPKYDVHTSPEQNLTEAANRFGAFIVYLFLYMLEPTDGKNSIIKKIPMSTEERREKKTYTTKNPTREGEF